MQPEPLETLQHLPHATTVTEDSAISQYGLQPDEQSPPPILHGGGRGGAESPSSDTDALHASVADGGVARKHATPRLSGPSTPSRDRITEYERASTPFSKKKPEGPVFEVIKKNRKPGDKRSPIADLPNGILQPHQSCGALVSPKGSAFVIISVWSCNSSVVPC